ncbi:hypothetical protein [Halorubellus sp. PRR65]|uniref:hypothetical protein n=1 Tax=Halorubellus sp. PRR65 TaxID=3098148 RepID=UPI002B25C8C7|nr:hypothetical protein [Halorubellus sp. PRR65]
MRALPALAVALLLVVAGCAAPTTPTESPTATDDATTPSTDQPTTERATTDDPTSTAPATTADEGTDDDGVPEPESLPVNDTATFRNLTEMLGVDADRPTLGTRNLSQYFRSRETTRKVLLGLEEYVQHPEDDPHGLATGNGRIYVQPAGASPTVVEKVVVHEQFHSVQFQRGWTAPRQPTTTDGRLAVGGAVEGASVWVAGEYTERYQREDVPRQVRMVRDAVVNGPDGWRVFRAPYYFGARWTEHHLDDPANVSWVYANPPETTEQLMHNLTASEAPVRPISVAVDADSWVESAGDRMGEAYVWATLRGELTANRSEPAAAGWGGDELRMVAGPGGETRNLTWAMRWDTAGDADEFAAAFDDWRSARDANASFSLVRVNESVTLLLAGDGAFVDAATVSMRDGTVVVERSNATATGARSTTAAAHPPSSAMAASRSR